jgi:hypothetical protein
VYNHRDEAGRRGPITVAAGLRWDPPRGAAPIEITRGVIAASAPDVEITLNTDSEHLARFFAGNWTLPDQLSPDPIATQIVALKHAPAHYGLNGDIPMRWFDRAGRTVYIVGSEYYGNVKISVRGLASAVAPPSQMFAHGCSLDVGGRGILICGNSGAGKTTATRRIREITGAKIVNDDWGSLSLDTHRAVYTSEQQLHMKYNSVRALAPRLPIGPDRYASENLSDYGPDADARLLIPRDEVFDASRVANETTIVGIAFLVRTDSGTSGARRLAAADVHEVEKGAFSTFYNRTEHFMNGSLMLTSEDDFERQRELHRRLLDDFPSLLVDNGGDADDAAAHVLRLLT